MRLQAIYGRKDSEHMMTVGSPLSSKLETPLNAPLFGKILTIYYNLLGTMRLQAICRRQNPDHVMIAGSASEEPARGPSKWPGIPIYLTLLGMTRLQVLYIGRILRIWLQLAPPLRSQQEATANVLVFGKIPSILTYGENSGHIGKATSWSYEDNWLCLWGAS